MLILGHRIAAVTRCVLPCSRTSIVRGNSIRAISVKRRNKIVQEITRNVANIFSFYATIAIEHVFFNALTFARSLGRCWKPRLSASVFNTSLGFHGTWRMLMYEKPCLIPIIATKTCRRHLCYKFPHTWQNIGTLYIYIPLAYHTVSGIVSNQFLK